jgi:hypothetical protein
MGPFAEQCGAICVPARPRYSSSTVLRHGAMRHYDAPSHMASSNNSWILNEACHS